MCPNTNTTVKKKITKDLSPSDTLTKWKDVSISSFQLSKGSHMYLFFFFLRDQVPSNVIFFFFFFNNKPLSVFLSSARQSL